MVFKGETLGGGSNWTCNLFLVYLIQQGHQFNDYLE